MPGYDKSKEKVLHVERIPDNDDHPEWSGTIINVKQYDGKIPSLEVKRYRLPRGEQEEKIWPFVDLPNSVVPKVVDKLTKLSKYITEKYGSSTGTSEPAVF